MRPAGVFNLPTEPPDQVLPRGSRTWVVRAQNFVVAVSDLKAGERLRAEETDDEHIVVVSSGTASVTHAQAGRVVATDSCVLIVPAGNSTLNAETDGRIVQIFTADCDGVLTAARNANTYETPDSLVAAPGPPARAPGSGIRTYRMDEIPLEQGRLGRIFRSSSLMINWFPDQNQPRDPDRLSPHSHSDFEQCTITLAGPFVHHLRMPWTSRLSDWRPDEHRRVDSPSVTIIPPQLIHTTQAVEDGLHQLLDVFAPPRQDFIDQGWVLNAADYSLERPAP
jgi:hypothetical protein